jgi:hypothetical protein
MLTTSIDPPDPGALSKGILDDATRDGNGNLLEVSFDWMRKGNNKHRAWTTKFWAASTSKTRL